MGPSSPPNPTNQPPVSASAASVSASHATVASALPAAKVLVASNSDTPALTRTQELVLKRIRDVPALPDVVNQIIVLLGKPTANATEIAKLIAYDPGLTSRVLRMVNSASYGFTRQISSIQHGIMILGFNTVRGLVLSASIFKLMKKDTKTLGFDAQAFWAHSLLTAMLASFVCDTYQIKQKEEAFSGGMLHDVGKLILAQYFMQDYVTVLKQARHLSQPTYGMGFLKLELKMTGLSHTEIGTHLADKWKLPSALAECVRFHHHPEQATLHPQLVYSVALANQVANLWHNELPLTLEALSPAVKEYFSLESESDLGFLADNQTQLLEQLAELQKSFV
jgi:putative nucleotidyltransferase with HDIG domain